MKSKILIELEMIAARCTDLTTKTEIHEWMNKNIVQIGYQYVMNQQDLDRHPAPAERDALRGFRKQACLYKLGQIVTDKYACLESYIDRNAEVNIFTLYVLGSFSGQSNNWETKV